MATLGASHASGVIVRALSIDKYAYALMQQMASSTKSYGQFLSALILAEHARRQERQHAMQSGPSVGKEEGKGQV